jgi:threonine dehydratase
MDALSVEDVRRARASIAGAVKVTPLDLSATFSALCGRQIHLKLENLQKTGSFKVRGGLHKIRRLGAAECERGVVTASAGNHAQGVAYAALTAGTKATVVMPRSASFSKIEATRGYGAEVILHGRNFAEACERAGDLAHELGATYVHAFDDDDVIAGQGTVGLEIVEQLADVDTVVVPVGGGGLIAGIAVALRGAGSTARIVGVQVSGAASLRSSLAAGRCVRVPVSDTIADGLATGTIGERPFEIIRSAVDDVVEVSEAETAGAVLLLLERAKTVVEGAGAVGLAACLAGRLPPGASKIVVVISGGNIDVNLLDRIINLGLATEGRLFRFTTELRDRPGELEHLVRCVAAAGANIHQIRHERARPGLAATRVEVTLELEARGRDHVTEIEQALETAGYARRTEADAESAAGGSPSSKAPASKDEKEHR